MDLTIRGGVTPGPDGLMRRDIFISDDVFAEAASPGAMELDASGLIVAPGLIDLHGDAFERNFSPRPNVFFDIDAALIETDRQLLTNGVTTAYLALTISWEPGLRSVENAAAFVEAWTRLRPHFITDIRLQLRWEVFALDAAETVESWLSLEPRPTLAFNDHFSMLLDPEMAHRQKVTDYAQRAGISVEDYNTLTARTKAREGEVHVAIERLANVANAAGVPCFAHDEKSPEIRRQNRAIGITVSEFPLTKEAAAEAADAGEITILGAPNVVRGGSHIGALNAEPAAEAGLCTALASDYFYPAQLQAAARMLEKGAMKPDAIWGLISGNPAKAAGLTDRGRLGPGARADLVIFHQDRAKARVEATVANGVLAFSRLPVRQV